MTDQTGSTERAGPLLAAGLVVLGACFVVSGRWEMALAVGVGGGLAWVLLSPDRITWAIFLVASMVPVTIDFGYPTNPSYTLLLLLFLLAVWGRLHHAERDGWRRTPIVAAILLPLCAVLAGVAHWHGAKPIVVGLAPLLCVGVLCWHVAEEARHDPQLIIRIARALTWLSVPIALFAKYQTLSLSWPIFDQFAYHWTYTSAFDASRAVGISGHPIIYGTFTMAMALVALTVRGRYWYVPLVANLVGLVLSGTRSAWVGILLALSFWMLFQWRRISWRALGTTLAVAAATAAVVAAKPPVSFLTTSPPPGPQLVAVAPAPSTAGAGAGAAADPATPVASPTSSGDPIDVTESRLSDSASADARLTRIRVIWDGITADWSTVVFGNGPEASVRFLENVGIGDGEAEVFDNTYLSFWYNFGLIGLACLLALLLMVFWRFRSLPARVLLIGLAAQVFFFDVWLWLGAVAVFVLAVALGAANGPASASQAPPGPPFGRRQPEQQATPGR
ncbi:O-antigen ligase family protein [Micromonospora sp. BQ11]|uniref:O-antigen ligase family protein n=1 Tax=Micromonospora sp. BQ11 TaxID=3452212 RepID=UPI003F890673